MLAALAVLILCVRSQKIGTAVLLVKTKYIVLPSQAVLILCLQGQITNTVVQRKKLAQLCTAKK